MFHNLFNCIAFPTCLTLNPLGEFISKYLLYIIVLDVTNCFSNHLPDITLKKVKKYQKKERLEFMKNNPDKTAWRLSNISYPEKLFIEYVEKNGLDKKYSIVREYSVFPYFIDFAFVNQMVAIEIDGSQHLLPERKERDDKKDKLLNELGWLVIRVSEKEIKSDIEEVFTKIVPLLNEKPKVNNIRIGMVVNPKKYQKKEMSLVLQKNKFNLNLNKEK